MSEEIKDMQQETDIAPVLSFDTGFEDAPAAPEVTLAPVVSENNALTPQEMQEQANLTPEELRQVEAFTNQIDISNTAAVMNYGVGTQKKLADFSEKALSNVRTKDLGEVGNMISSLVTELKSFNVDEQDRGIIGFFKKKANSLTAIKSKYAKVETNVVNIKNELEKHQVTLMKDSAMLDQMYQMNLTYFKELTMYILAGKKKLQEVRENELVQLQTKAAASGLPEDAQAAKDMAAKCDSFEKKIHDLELTRTISMQTAPQIRMVQNSDNLMAEKIQSTIVNTIPLWKNQMVIAMGIQHATQAAQAQREVSDMTNELLKKNADALKTATIESAKESERGIVDIETLKHTNEMLISTMDEVLTIQREGKEKRLAAQNELVQIENQLKAKLLEAAKG
ncbi:MAG: toxic anion resistance protein [Anaerovoracaceae bacterium]